MENLDTIAIIDMLKKVLKGQKITYKKVSTQLNVSEISIKRIFSKYECSISRLTSICEVAGISLLELAEIAKKEKGNQNYFLTTKQENYFVKNPFLLHFFSRIYRGESLEIVSRSLQLSPEDTFTYLRQLEKIELLELYPDNHFRFKISGRIRWNLNGPLYTKLLKKQNIQFLEEVYNQVKRDDCCFQSSELQLTKQSLSSIVQEIHELGKKYREISYHEERTSLKKDLVNVRWLFAFLPYQTNWEQYK